MKKERNTITISDSGIVSVPASVEIRMTIGEIAGLFGIYYQTIKRHIRAIEKSAVAGGDYSMSCTVEGMQVYPDYYGLEVIIAVAFRVQTKNAEIFRNWLIRKAVSGTTDMPNINILICREWNNISLN
jgi:hypothetical protein